MPPQCWPYIFCLHNYNCGFYLQITPWQIGYMPVPQGRSGALTQSTRLSNWKRSFCSICTSLETADSRSLGSWIWPRGRSKSGFRTGGWRWRKWTKKRPTAKNNNMDWSQKTPIITTSHMDSTDVPKHTMTPPSSSPYIYHFVGFCINLNFEIVWCWFCFVFLFQCTCICVGW